MTESAALTPEEIRALLVCRVVAATESCNSHHINHVEGQIKALLAVLTGAPPGHLGSNAEILRCAGIPVTEVDDEIEWNDEWLEAHGFEVDEDDFDHPRFGKGW